MRVTGNNFQDSLINQLNLLSARQYRLQAQAATGQRIQAPEDDPAGLAQALNLQTENSNVGQFADNIGTLQNRATLAFGALSALKNISDRVGELAISADGTRSPQELQIYAGEVSQLIQHAVQVMNSKDGEQHMFAGTLSDQPPFTVTVDGNGYVTGVTYQGNTTVNENEVAENSTVAVDVPGANTSGTGPRGLITDTRYNADFFNHLISLQNNLLAGNTAAIAATDRAALADDEENILYHVSHNGAMQARLETAAAVANARGFSLEDLITRTAGADLTQTLLQLSQTQNAYQVALQSSASIMQHRNSLMDYLS